MEFFTPEGWGTAMQLTDMTAREMGKIISDIARQTKNPMAALAAVRMLDEKNRAVLRAAKVLRTVRGREVLHLPEQVIDGKRVSGKRVLEIEGEELSESVIEVERRLADAMRSSRFTPVRGVDDDDNDEFDDDDDAGITGADR